MAGHEFKHLALGRYLALQTAAIEIEDMTPTDLGSRKLLLFAHRLIGTSLERM